MSKSLPKIKQAIGILTCQIAPGYEDEIINSLTNRDGFCKPELFFDSLSDFDLIGIVTDLKENKIRENIEKFKCISNGLKDVQLITCFPLQTSILPNPIFDINDNNALTITLIRATGDLYIEKDEFGLQYEAAYANRLSKALHRIMQIKNINFDFAIYGTLGIPNMILVQRGKNLSTLLSNLTEINGMQDTSEALYFHTIPCIRKQIIDNHWDITEVDGEMYWRIGISCFNVQPPKLIDELSKDFLSLFPNITSTPNFSFDDLLTVDYAYGKRDIVLRPKNPPHHSQIVAEEFPVQKSFLNKLVIKYIKIISNNFGFEIVKKSNPTTEIQIGFSPKNLNFLNRIIKLISVIGRTDEFKNKIETKTELFIDQFDESLSHAYTADVPNLINNINNKIDEEIRNWFDVALELRKNEESYEHPQFDAGNKLLDLVERFQVTYNIPQMWEIIFDMKDYLNTVIIVLAKSISDKLPRKSYMDCEKILPSWYVQLEDAMQIFYYSLDKRLAGVELGIGNKVVSSVSGLGNFRTLLAAKAVSYGLFSATGLFWEGFTVFNFRPTTSCLALGIINMPGYSIEDLKSWIQIGHETGHAFVDQNKFMEKVLFISALNDELKKCTLSEFRRTDDCFDFIDELLADGFEYLMCFGGNFELYRDTTWQNLDQDLLNSNESDSVFRHLLRTISILYIHLENIGLLESGEELRKFINVENGLANIYSNKDIEYGVKKYTLGQVETIQELIRDNVIGPLLDNTNIRHVDDAIMTINIQELCDLSQVIDRYRSAILLLFINPIKENNDLIKKNNYERGKWDKKIKKFASKLSRDEVAIIDPMNPIEVSCLLLAIQKLKTEKKNDFNTNLAAMLSLWNYYRIEFVQLLRKRINTS